MYRKYHNTKTVADGIKFDSKLEAERYAQLKILERAGVIRELELQPYRRCKRLYSGNYGRFPFKAKTVRIQISRVHNQRDDKIKE